MALFYSESLDYDESVRQTGFNRYKQLMSFHAMDWLKINLLTTLGALPFAVGVTFSILSSSSLVLIPCSLLGGAVFGPFHAGMIDSIQRGLRDDPHNWWSNYKKSWKQNGTDSIIPGALFGLITGMLIFMLYMLWNAQTASGWGTISLYLFSLVMLTIIQTLYWPQLVLFKQSLLCRMRNILLFTSKYLWRVLGVALLQLAWLALLALFAPLTLVVIPFLGFWFILFISQLLIYDQLNQELHIEELYFPDRA